uniref:Uncharacterized protein n=1 Tax=viral metagenome TaxID=1070528 RepID=A0A6C0D4Y6_9ZZZZ
MATIVSGSAFNVNTDYVYTKPKINANNGKSIGILNKHNMKSLYISTPLMLTWGVNEWSDDKTGKKSFDLALQFPSEENSECSAFLKNMQELEMRIKSDVITNCKEWLGKPKMSSDAVDALWSPMLKYPKDKASDEFDYSRAPTLKVKLGYWEGKFKCGSDDITIYNETQELLFPNDDNNSIIGLIAKGSNIATIIQCGGIWVANGKFGVTWKLLQAVVKPRTTLSGKCHIVLSEKDKEKLVAPLDDEDDDDEPVKMVSSVTEVPDSDDDEPNVKDEHKEEPKEQVKEEAKQVEVEDAPKKKRIVKKKSDE